MTWPSSFQTRIEQERKLLKVHDNFDGSVRCVECQGECQLTGADARLTTIIRYLFEGAAERLSVLDLTHFPEGPWSYLLNQEVMEILGKDRFKEFFQRARETRGVVA